MSDSDSRVDGSWSHNSSSGTSPYNSDLAYGGSSSDSSLDETAWHGVTGQMRFQTAFDGRTMERLQRDLAALPADFQAIRRMAGDVIVTFGLAEDGGAGVFREGGAGRPGEIVLNPNHSSVRGEGSSRLLGTAMFEILNAASAPRLAELDASARRGDVARAAARAGVSPAQYYGREVENIEFDNAITHRRLVADMDRTGTHMDLLDGTVPLLDTSAARGSRRYQAAFQQYYNFQVESGHTFSYENRYQVVRPPRPIVSAAAALQSSSDTRRHGPSSGGEGSHRHQRSDHRSSRRR
ncbi:hypothetical protein [Dactylosporangium sp. CA-092794]|uniref:hypothetical protein n=1 Tax=Dactylosporangium sp. CA-092794 TaxID=3239929 RepID=UPI003D8A0EB1